MKTAVIFANGVEEGEALTIVDIFRRAEVDCQMVGLDRIEIVGSHGFTMVCDSVLDETGMDYDMIILPGGYGGVDVMCHHSLLLEVLRKMDHDGKYIAAICAAPLVLDHAGILRNRNFTCYPSVLKKIYNGSYSNLTVCADENLITGMGPALVWKFAYELLDVLGIDSDSVKKRMVYQNAFEEERG